MEALDINRFNLILTCIKNIESFDGNDPNQLPDFINQIENILPIIFEFDSSNRNIIFGYIKNKCVGKTREAIHRYANVNTWETLKEILINNFGEKDSSNDLMDNLKTCRLQGTIENYYFKINKLANKIHNRNLTHRDNTYTTEEVSRISLKTFRDHLPEPTRTLIFARNPNSLEDAFKIILDARHQHYTQFGPPKTESFSTIRTNFSNEYKNNKNPFRNYANNENRIDEPINSNPFNNYNSGIGSNYNNFRNKHLTPYRNEQQFQARHGDFNQNINYNSTNSEQIRQSNYLQNGRTYRNPQYSRKQPIPSGTWQTHNSRKSNKQVEPMEIGNSSVNFPNAVEQTYPT